MYLYKYLNTRQWTWLKIIRAINGFRGFLICVCVYVCVCIYICVHIHILRACMHLCMYIYTIEYLYSCKYLHFREWTWAKIPGFHAPVAKFIGASCLYCPMRHQWTWLLGYPQCLERFPLVLDMCVCLCVCLYIYIYIYIYTYIYIYIHLHTACVFVCMHMCIYICICVPM